jgi:hypothetical protein
LRRIEFEAALIANNPKYHVEFDDGMPNLLREKSTDLMSAIITFFDSALIYLSNGFFGRVGSSWN